MGTIDTTQVAVSFLIVLNVIGFGIMKVDKRRAINRKYRISERSLWIIALCGGAIGMVAGMYVFHHKTKHLSFKIGLPLLIIIQLIVVWWVAF